MPPTQFQMRNNTGSGNVAAVPSFTLLPATESTHAVIDTVSAACGLSRAFVSDVYPCSLMQKELMASASKVPGDYVLQGVLELSPDLCLDRFYSAWDKLVAKFDVLRTRIVHHPSLGLLQVVTNELVTWQRERTLAAYRKRHPAHEMGLTKPLSRYAIVQDADGSGRFFVWTIHHAIYDGWLLKAVTEALWDVYHGGPVAELQPFNNFIRHALSQDHQAARKHWASYLESCDMLQFPLALSSVDAPAQPFKAERSCLLGHRRAHMKQPALIFAALAIVAGSWTNSRDVVFGTIRSGRSQAHAKITRQTAGPTIAAVPVRIRLDENVLVHDWLRVLQDEYDHAASYEQFGLSEIRKINHNTETACNFNTMIVVQPRDNDLVGDASFGRWLNGSKDNAPRTYALNMQAFLQPDGVRFTADTDTAIMSKQEAAQMLDRLCHVVEQLTASTPECRLVDIDMLSPSDRERLWSLNAQVPPTLKHSVNEMIMKEVQRRPSAPAICAWDGDLTYAELDRLTTQLAMRLTHLGVEKQQAVPLCFEKSKMAVIAMVAVLKAGAIFVPIDPFQGQDRREQILTDIDASLVLSSISYLEALSREGRTVVVVDSSLFEENLQDETEITPPASPVSLSSVAYILFTSGSTGTPKGVVVPHAAFSSSCFYHGKAMGMTQDTRIFQFASFAFDVCLMEIFTTLVHGGCICMPSEHDRINNTESSIVALKANYAAFTPSFARHLVPDRLPLQTVMFGGESSTPEDFARWKKEGRRLLNAYGPTECTVVTTIHVVGSEAKPAGSGSIIGTPVGSVAWVCTTDGSSRPLPVGAVGELLVEGPIVARGYANNSEQTSQAFIENPDWLLNPASGHPGRSGRLYKTGDLVRRKDSGVLEYIGRKDTQVKIRGQRVELGEVEHQLLASIEGAYDVATELVVPKGSVSKPTLTAFVVLSGDNEENTNQGSRHNGVETAATRVMTLSSKARDAIAKRLPAYMIPEAYLAINKMPLSTTGKVDRRQLRTIASKFSFQELKNAQTSCESKTMPRTVQEELLHSIWANILKVEPCTIGVFDSIFSLGGDSITAMAVVSQAHAAQLNLSVADIFVHKTIAALVEVTATIQTDLDVSIPPFSLMGERGNEYCSALAAEHGMDTDQIEDAYPCTPLQQGLLSLTYKTEGEAFTFRAVLKLDPQVDMDKFQQVWAELVELLPILRTRIIQSEQFGLVQVVLHERIQWEMAEDLRRYMRRDSVKRFELGSELVRFGLIACQGTHTPGYFVFTIHHALYDGQFMSQLFNLAEEIYHGNNFSTPVDFKYFIRYLNGMDRTTAANFWKAKLAGYNASPFPALQHLQEPQPKATETRRIQLRPIQVSNITAATVIRAAWALTAAASSGDSDVIFGAVQSGRNARVAHVQHIAGPTIVTVPVRINVDPTITVAEFLRKVHTDAINVVPHEQLGLQHISSLSQEARLACQFQTLLVVQPPQDADETKSLGQWRDMDNAELFATHALTLICSMTTDDAVCVRVVYDEAIVSQPAVSRLLDRMSSFLEQLSATEHTQLAGLSVLPQSECSEIWGWNQVVPSSVDRCLHAMVEEVVSKQPDAEAVCAWDGNFTYRELDDLASRLASCLVELGVTIESMVPVYFEKSKWTIVAMLAILKAGAAFIPNDPSQASDRRERLFAQANVRVVLASSNHAAEVMASHRRVLAVDQQLMDSLPMAPSMSQPLANPSPNCAAYTIFTSGSTGQPKGVVVEHRAISSNCIYHGQAMGFSADSRVLQFCAYTFDPNILEIFTTLIYGGCVCVPSDADRLGDIESCMNNMAVDTAIFTPSTARLLDPQRMTTLRKLIMGGENAVQEDFAKWSGLETVMNVYGPAECSIVHSLNVVDFSINQDACIGKAVGSVSWIVMPGNPNCLAPVNSVGELLVEGPILFRGYLNESEKTAASLIENPAWLQQGAGGHPGRTGVLYKTGDLVKYDDQGRLIYVGRVDTVVKLRGQRVELGEVEYWMRECIAEATLVACEVIVPQGASSKPMLAAFIMTEQSSLNTLDNSDSRDLDSAELEIFPMSAETENVLSEKLPSHMIPAVCFRVGHINLNSSGKTDRRHLRTIGSSISIQKLAEMRVNSSQAKRMPETDSEHSLQKIWATVLNIDLAIIGIDDSFFQLGGDSISAMQVSAMSRASQNHVTTSEILRLKTIARLAPIGRRQNKLTAVDSLRQADMVGQSFNLSPIQQLYVQLQKDPRHCFDQHFFLKFRQSISFKTLEIALETILSRNAMLRARFTQLEDKSWQQCVSQKGHDCFEIEHVKWDGSDKSHLVEAIRICRSKLDIENGPLVAAVFFDGSSSQKLFITAHHLVIDLVSWRAVLKELEEILTTTESLLPVGTSFQAWCAHQGQYAAKALALTDASLQAPESRASYWGLTESTNQMCDTASFEFTMDEATTTKLLGSCNSAFGTRPVELMIAALAHSFSLAFDDRDTPTIFAESHGRESNDDLVDISRTVGWFTTMYPVLSGAEPSSDLFSLIRQTKDSMRQASDNGWSYFTSLFVDRERTLSHSSMFPVEVVLNYAGIYQQLERADACFELTSMPSGCDFGPPSDFQRFALFDVMIGIERGCMAISMVYHTKALHQHKIANWSALFKTDLEQLSAILPSKAPEWTLSDFPTLFRSYDDIHETKSLLRAQANITSLDQVEDMYNCSATQEGILIAQAKDSSNYRSSLDFKLVSTRLSQQIDLARVEEAWRAVVRRHSLLRAIFVSGVPGSAGTTQIILRNPTPNISIVQSINDVRKMQSNRPYEPSGLQHHLFAYSAEDGGVCLSLAINHCIVDAYSIDILLQDFKKAFMGSLDANGPAYRDFIDYEAAQPVETSRAFWNQYLDGVAPCLFPTLVENAEESVGSLQVHVPELDSAGIHDFCAKWDLTTATIMQAAWGLVLRQYSGSAISCFGMMTSCRDAPLEGVDAVLGPLINMIPCQIQLYHQKSVIDVLRDVQTAYINALAHQTYSLAAINSERNVGATGLFNSILSLQRGVKELTASDNGYDILVEGGFDPVEVSNICVLDQHELTCISFPSTISQSQHRIMEPTSSLTSAFDLE